MMSQLIMFDNFIDKHPSMLREFKNKNISVRNTRNMCKFVKGLLSETLQNTPYKHDFFTHRCISNGRATKV